MFGSFGRALAECSVTFVSRAALEGGIRGRLDLTRATVAVGKCRGLSKRDMVNNNLLPALEVDPDTYEVRADGELPTCEPARELAMAHRYFLF